jgi:hypothetical protein
MMKSNPLTASNRLMDDASIDQILFQEEQNIDNSVIVYDERTLCGDQPPPPPMPQSLQQMPPKFSPKYPAAIDRKTKIMLTWNRMDADGIHWVPSDPSQPYFPAWRDGRTPPPYEIIQRYYWELLDHQILEPGGSATYGRTYLQGTSVTNTTAFSGELGVEGKSGISAKLSYGFSRSVTIEESQQLSIDTHWTNPHQQAVSYSVWQLVQEFSIITAADCRDPLGAFFPKGTLYSEVMKADGNGVSTWASGIAGSGHQGWVYCLEAQYRNKLPTRQQVTFG